MFSFLKVLFKKNNTNTTQSTQNINFSIRINTLIKKKLFVRTNLYLNEQ